MPRIGIAYDVRGWAWWARAMALQKYAPLKYKVEVFDQAMLERLRATGSTKHFDALLVFSWPEVAPNFPGCKRAWTFIANSGCMYQWNSQARDFRQRGASKIKNYATARKRLPEYYGIININPACTEFARRLNPRTYYMRTGIDHNFYQPHWGEPESKLRVGWCGKSFDDPKLWTSKGYHEVFLPLQKRMGGRVKWAVNRRSARDALSPDEMVDWYNSIDVLLVTSSCEGTPSVLLEAMSCGKPAIATGVGIAPEVIEGGRNGFIVGGYRNAQGASEIINRCEMCLDILVNDWEKCFWMGRMARQEIERAWTWERLARSWFDLMVTA